jgi:heat shock protein HslJ
MRYNRGEWEEWLELQIEMTTGIVTWLRSDVNNSLWIIIGLLIITGTAGCLAHTSPPEDLTGHSWRLIFYNNGSALVETNPVPPIVLTLEPDGTFSGSSGCNNYSGSYQLDGGLISIADLNVTERNCSYPERVMQMEQDYLNLLTSTTRYSIDQDELALSYYDVKKLLIFEKI